NTRHRHSGNCGQNDRNAARFDFHLPTIFCDRLCPEDKVSKDVGILLLAAPHHHHSTHLLAAKWMLTIPREQVRRFNHKKKLLTKLLEFDSGRVVNPKRTTIRGVHFFCCNLSRLIFSVSPFSTGAV